MGGRPPPRTSQRACRDMDDLLAGRHGRRKMDGIVDGERATSGHPRAAASRDHVGKVAKVGVIAVAAYISDIDGQNGRL